MKVIGKKSLSSIIMIFLEILLVLCVIAILSGGIIAIENFSILISSKIAMTALVIYASSIPALVLIIQFISIFKTLKEGNVFQKQNIGKLKTSYVMSILIGIMYTFNGIQLFLFYENKDVITLYVILTYIIALVFLIFGIGLMVLSEIYQKAIEYKEENDLTI